MYIGQCGYSPAIGVNDLLGQLMQW